jgi:hypothetical protein
MNRLRTTTAILAIAVTSAIALASCSTPEPKPSDSSSPTSASATPTQTGPTEPTVAKVGPPSSADQALQDAGVAFISFIAMTDLIYSQGGENPDRIKEFSTGDALQFATTQANFLRDEKSKFEGVTKISITNGYAVDASRSDGSKIPNGGANITACQDQSSMKTINPDGTSLPVGSKKIVTAEAIYSPEAGSWQVSKYINSSGQGTSIQC